MIDAPQSLHLWLGGRVQGVGYRPFVYRLGRRLGLKGWVRNRLGRVEIHAQGDLSSLATFQSALIREAPPLAQPLILSCTASEEIEREEFRILASETSEEPEIHVPPDYFLCDDCLHELMDPANRRYRYPFINCTQCGPRYTLIERLPYDRANTSMASFALCPACRAEYENPLDRRFHAEPIACPACGPRLQFVSSGAVFNEPVSALQAGIDALRKGLIVAVKGVGGYHLMCDAANDIAVARLRKHKPRPHKPLAVMFPVHDGLAALDPAVVRTPLHDQILLDPMRPIVLMPKRAQSPLSNLIAPDLDEIGVMLPYSPLHHLLLRDLGRPVVATSANISGEPVITDNAQVERRLDHVADAYLHHDRPIVRPADDAVFRVIAGRSRPLRLGRGNAPCEYALPKTLQVPTLAVGGHMKSTVALAWGRRVVVSPHIGDLDSIHGLQVFERVIVDLQALHGVRARRLVCDAHPDYASRRWAERTGEKLSTVFHHRAHASALAGEYPDVERWLTFTWDGVGYGEDGTLWGGEALFGRPGAWNRVATMRPFHLPGGDRVAREPWRSACALAWETGHVWDAAPRHEASLLRRAWQRRINTPTTSSAGRLFDAASAFISGLHVASFEGQGPMQLEALARRAQRDATSTVILPVEKNPNDLWQVDWAPLLPYLTDDTVPAAVRAAGFHESLAQSVIDTALKARAQFGDFVVGLSGGVFQNRLLVERICAGLAYHGIGVYLPTQVPCNDAGISVGQIIETLFIENAS